jgi:hypothetical protein
VKMKSWCWGSWLLAAGCGEVAAASRNCGDAGRWEGTAFRAIILCLQSTKLVQPQPLNYARVRENRSQWSVQHCAVLAGTAASYFWAAAVLISLSGFEITESDSATAVALTGGCTVALALFSLASLALTAGIFPSRRGRYAVAATLLSGHALAACWFYRGLELQRPLAGTHLVLQGISVALIFVGAEYGLAAG